MVEWLVNSLSCQNVLTYQTVAAFHHIKFLLSVVINKIDGVECCKKDSL